MNTHDESKHPRATNGTWTDKHRDEPEMTLDADGVVDDLDDDEIDAMVRRSQGLSRTATLTRELVEDFQDLNHSIRVAAVLREEWPAAAYADVEPADAMMSQRVTVLDANGKKLATTTVVGMTLSARAGEPSQAIRGRPTRRIDINAALRTDLHAASRRYDQALAHALCGGSAWHFGQIVDQAVHMQSRHSIERDMGRKLSDEEWAKVLPHMDDYDEWMDTHAKEQNRQWLDRVYADTGLRRYSTGNPS